MIRVLLIVSLVISILVELGCHAVRLRSMPIIYVLQFALSVAATFGLVWAITQSSDIPPSTWLLCGGVSFVIVLLNMLVHALFGSWHHRHPGAGVK